MPARTMPLNAVQRRFIVAGRRIYSKRRCKSTRSEIMDQRIINLYHHFTHGGMNRRQFLDRLAELVGSTAAAAALVPLLQNDYAKAAIVVPDDPRLVAERMSYESANGQISRF